MSSLESNKNLAGIGSILLMFPFVNVVGIILVFVGMKGLAEYYKDDRIYHDAFRGLIFLIIAAVAIAVMVPLFILSGTFGIFALGPLGVGFGLISFFLVIAVVFVFYLLAAINLRKAFNALAQKSGEHMFETAGMLLFFGAIFTHNISRLSANLPRLDNRNNRVLLHQSSPTTIRVHTSTGSATNTGITILSKLRSTTRRNHNFLLSLRKTTSPSLNSPIFSMEKLSSWHFNESSLYEILFILFCYCQM